MNIKLFLVNLGKLLLCVLAYVTGITLGRMLASGLRLQQPAMPEGLDAASAGIYVILESPLLAYKNSLMNCCWHGGKYENFGSAYPAYLSMHI